MCPCPAWPAVFARPTDLTGAVDALRRWPAGAVVSLMEAHEFERLGLGELPGLLRERTPLWLHLPIRDGDIPGPAWLERWRLARLVIAGLLAEGDNVAVHCLAGVGRTGLVASLCLIDAGARRGFEAIERVRRAHTVHAVETPEQQNFVEAYRPESILTEHDVHAELAQVAAEFGATEIVDGTGRIDKAVAATALSRA
ncbi:MAG: hypothetical protein RQ847_10020 [Wenzhouxiangellaceae bacterium]|nr:hypothetical protein [Wenzhouxiangellaceae bacterium]